MPKITLKAKKKQAVSFPKTEVMLRRIIRHYAREKDEFYRIKAAGKRAKNAGYFTMPDFLNVCHWKSPRPKKHYESNSEDIIKKATEAALSTNYEKRKMAKLAALKGVSIPVGSALLTAVDPKNYGVIDIRVWQVLYLFGSVNKKADGRSLNMNNWITFLFKMRYWAKKLDVSVRKLEVSLFWFHRDHLQGSKTLYDPSRCFGKGLSKKKMEELKWLLVPAMKSLLTGGCHH